MVPMMSGELRVVMDRWRLGAAALLAASFVLVGAQVADEDGSRMRAPQIELPSQHTDDLSPPSDRVDWRYVGLEAQTSLSVKLNVTDKGKEASLEIRRASGDSLFDESTTDGTASFEKTLEPGILYIGVSSESALSYRLTVKN
jgi:hypothetical protein